MANLNLPSTQSIATTATTVTVNGHHDELAVRNLGNTPVYIRTDGTDAAIEADYNYAIPPYQGNDICIEVVPSGGAFGTDSGTPVTVFSAISKTSANLLAVFVPDED